MIANIQIIEPSMLPTLRLTVLKRISWPSLEAVVQLNPSGTSCISFSLFFQLELDLRSMIPSLSPIFVAIAADLTVKNTI